MTMMQGSPWLMDQNFIEPTALTGPSILQFLFQKFTYAPADLEISWNCTAATTQWSISVSYLSLDHWQNRLDE